jgi:uncharacterized membrane protein YkvA (DUF1232 family)
MMDERMTGDKRLDLNPPSEKSFWDKLKHFAKAAGQDVVERALCLYFAAQRPDTPLWAKTVIYGALTYFISPLDAVPDITPVLGYSDDLGVLVSAVLTVAMYVSDDVRQQARDKLRIWFA